MSRFGIYCLLAAVAGGLAGCTSDYSPNTYSSSAVQQANKVEPAVVVGFRQIAISANGTVGAVTGGAAGGILGAQVGSAGFNAALGTVGGSAIGSILGTTMEHIAGDTTGWEYIVRKPNGELLSLTQREPEPLPIGQKVLVITGSQARIVPDHSGLGDPQAPPPAATPAPAPAPAPVPDKPKAAITAEPLAAPAAAGSSADAGSTAPAPTVASPAPVRLTAPVEASTPTVTSSPSKPNPVSSVPVVPPSPPLPSGETLRAAE